MVARTMPRSQFIPICEIVRFDSPGGLQKPADACQNDGIQSRPCLIGETNSGGMGLVSQSSAPISRLFEEMGNSELIEAEEIKNQRGGFLVNPVALVHTISKALHTCAVSIES